MMRRRDDERGVVAVFVAITALVLLGVAALSVDLSQAYWQKREIQKRADFAALAGAAGDDLPATAAGGSCVHGSFGWTAPKATDQAVVDAAAYLNDHPDYAPTGSDVTPTQLVDCDLANGEAAYGSWTVTQSQGFIGFTPNQNQLSVVTQPRNVKFGFAAVLGFTNVDVAGQATVEIKTKLLSTLPLYAASGCDYGQQTIAQPTNGQSSSGVNLANSSDKNTYITEVSPLTVNPASTSTPPFVQMNSSATSLTITGTNLDKVTSVGFFRSAATNPPAPEQVTSGFTVSGTTSLTVTIPSAVTAIQDTWFVRLLGTNKPNNGSPEWTPVTQNGNANNQTNLAALPFTVGNATLQCNQGSTDGNFGTLDLFNYSAGAPNGQADNIAYNIAAGLQYGLAPYPAQYLSADGTCTPTQQGAIVWPSSSATGGDGTNCVGTKPGLDSQAATEGFVTGVASAHGLLATSSGTCPFDYPQGTTHMTTAPTGQSINNDVLTCFFTADTKTDGTPLTVGDVSSSTYNGPAVIDQSIYKCPRFVLIPVLYALPASGSSTLYEIKDFRPAFITDESATATRASGAPTTGNGLTWSSSSGSPKLMSVNVVFLNPKALPNPPLDSKGKYIAYVGNGMKTALLVN